MKNVSRIISTYLAVAQHTKAWNVSRIPQSLILFCDFLIKVTGTLHEPFFEKFFDFWSLLLITGDTELTALVLTHPRSQSDHRLGKRRDRQQKK